MQRPGAADVIAYAQGSRSARAGERTRGEKTWQAEASGSEGTMSREGWPPIAFLPLRNKHYSPVKEVTRRRAKDRYCSLQICPPFSKTRDLGVVLRHFRAHPWEGSFHHEIVGKVPGRVSAHMLV